MKSLFEFYEGDEERCGFILDDGQVLELKNIHPEPQKGFEIDAEEILRYISRIAAIWHTHPGSTSVLSGEDKLCMEMWPQVKHMIVGKDGITTYRVVNGAVLNEDYLPR